MVIVLTRLSDPGRSVAEARHLRLAGSLRPCFGLAAHKSVARCRYRRLTLITVEAELEHGQDSDDVRPSPTPEQLTDGAVRLLAEVDEAFAASGWAILDRGSKHVTWLLYDGAALRHCCRLLYEMEIAAAADIELGVRLLARAHLEAWLVGLYIHYGGFEAVARVAQDTRHSLESTNNEASQFDQWLLAEQKAARKSAQKVERANKGIAQWNEANPDRPAKTLLDEPYMPKLQPTGLNLSDRIAAFGEHEAQSLPVSDIVDALIKLAPEKGFGFESFRPLYLIYRVLSGIGTHASLNILDAYLTPGKSGRFIRIAPQPVNGSMIDSARITALHATAFLARAVIGDQGTPTPVADEIETWLRPDPSGRSAWEPGT
jgi:hypothetical protein